MIINYGISKKRKSENHKTDIPAEWWDTKDGGKKICERIYQKHPGWRIVGYAKAQKEEVEDV